MRQLATRGNRSEYAGDWQPDYFYTTEQLLQSLATEHIHILDARSADRFSGAAAEPRAGVRSGHIPGALNLPFVDCLINGHLKPQNELADIVTALGIQATNAKPLVTSCGSGVTACILALAALELGIQQVSVYDGSWAEWGSRQDLPIETG